MKILILSLLVFVTSAMAGELQKFDAEAETLKVVHGVKVLSGQQTSIGNPVKQNTMGEYGGGVLLGRPVKFSYKGIVFNTYELEINQGAFEDSSLYIGAVISASTDRADVFEKFKTLDQSKQYVFEYKYIHPFNPEIENSHLQIIAVYTPEEFLASRGIKEVPQSLITKRKYQGSVSDGSDNDRTGRVVDVERYGMVDDFCTIELNLGGVRESGGSGSSEALLVLTVLDDDVCTYAENIMPLGLDVHVNYSEDFWEVWNPTSRFANGITLTIPTSNSTSIQVPAVSTSSTEYEKIKNQLLNDPEFLRSIADKLKQQ